VGAIVVALGVLCPATAGITCAVAAGLVGGVAGGFYVSLLAGGTTAQASDDDITDGLGGLSPLTKLIK
jgi:hypothetical protein